MRTYKKDNKFMGTCFIEFERFDRMQTALQKYHHSVFSDGTKKNERKINVELRYTYTHTHFAKYLLTKVNSAGGGGNTPARMDKIKAKNEKLTNERQRIRERRDEVDAKQKERKDKKDTKGKKDNKDADAEAEEPAEDNSGMHPARLALLNQPTPAWKGRQRY
jgi:nucleolar protein 6